MRRPSCPDCVGVVLGQLAQITNALLLLLLASNTPVQDVAEPVVVGEPELFDGKVPTSLTEVSPPFAPPPIA